MQVDTNQTIKYSRIVEPNINYCNRSLRYLFKYNYRLVLDTMETRFK